MTTAQAISLIFFTISIIFSLRAVYFATKATRYQKKIEALLTSEVKQQPHEQLTVGKYIFYRHPYDGDVIVLLKTDTDINKQQSVYIEEKELEPLIAEFFEFHDKEQNSNGENSRLEAPKEELWPSIQKD